MRVIAVELYQIEVLIGSLMVGAYS